jgi:hypothetical protein
MRQILRATSARAFGVARDAMKWGSDHWHLKWDNKTSARIDVLEVSWSFKMGMLS